MNPKIGIEAIRNRLKKDFGYELHFQTRRKFKGENINIPYIADNVNHACRGITIAVAKKGEMYRWGKAYCSSEDIYDKNYGRLMASRRILRQMLERPVNEEPILDFSDCPALSWMDEVDYRRIK